jgi:DNA-binding CsgD family transcriptional regulator
MVARAHERRTRHAREPEAPSDPRELGELPGLDEFRDRQVCRARPQILAEGEEIAARLAALSNRERQVLKLVVDGRLNKQIADDLGISIKTVKVHRANVMKTMAVRSLAELVHLCDLASGGSGECLFGARTDPLCARRACLNSGGRCEKAPRPRD